jgi:hypothetical protein
MVVAQKGEGCTQGQRIDRTDVIFNRLFFSTQMSFWNYKLRRGGFVIFGASSMLPVFSYYLPVLSKAEFIADDDKGKEGIYRDLLVTPDYSLTDKDVVIASASKATSRKLLTKALQLGARNVYTPFQ